MFKPSLVPFKTQLLCNSCFCLQKSDCYLTVCRLVHCFKQSHETPVSVGCWLWHTCCFYKGQCIMYSGCILQELLYLLYSLQGHIDKEWERCFCNHENAVDIWLTPIVASLKDSFRGWVYFSSHNQYSSLHTHACCKEHWYDSNLRNYALYFEWN